MPNTELLQRTLAHIEAHPDQWDQTMWATKTECGTAYCFAGWTVAIARPDAVPVFEDDCFSTCEVSVDGARVYIDELAIKLLGLSAGDADELFHASNTIEELREMVADLTAATPADPSR